VRLPEPLSTSEVDRLGRRLRHGTVISDDDLSLLQRHLFNHSALLEAAESAIREGVRGVTPHGRLKTVGTIVDKLRRESTMALSRMRDVAGTRIVEEMNRVEQSVVSDEVADALRNLGQVTVIDRRRDPRHGYRAIHLELSQRPYHVEVQIRTRMQDQWAQIVERLGDRWGRQIRYGQPPSDPEASIGPTMTRMGMWEIVQDMSDAIDEYEVVVAREAGRPEGVSEEAQRLRSQIDAILDQIAQVAERL
jgi:hypothetical protein